MTDTKSESRLKRVKKNIFFDSVTKHYRYRVWFRGSNIEKVIGPSKEATEIALGELKQELFIHKQKSQLVFVDRIDKNRKAKTFRQAAERFLAERVDAKISTIQSYHSILKCYLLPEFGTKMLRDIAASDIKKFQARLNLGKDNKLTASRINTIMQPLRTILGSAFKNGELDRDPSLTVRRLVEEKPEIDPLSGEELTLVLANIDPHYHTLFLCLAHTGARPNEMLALRWSDIDWRSETLKISKGRVRGVEAAPKTMSSKRIIPMSKQMIVALQQLRADGNRTFALSDHVFLKPNGMPIDKHLDRIWNRAIRKAGIRHRPSYQLRHTFATHCLNSGFPLKYIAEVLGHSSITTLLEHYAGFLKSSTKEYDDQVRRLFDSDSDTELVRPFVRGNVQRIYDQR
jgi:integrase